jgi:hypothetical protein
LTVSGGSRRSHQMRSHVAMSDFHRCARLWLVYAIPQHQSGISKASFQQHAAQAYTQLGAGQTSIYPAMVCHSGGPVWPFSWSLPVQWGNANGLLRYPGPTDRVRHVSGDRCCALHLPDGRLIAAELPARIPRKLARGQSMGARYSGGPLPSYYIQRQLTIRLPCHTRLLSKHRLRVAPHRAHRSTM